ncbi:MAG TPA: GNAT family N-acetyltransferase [Verrucomicrobiae bacterium]|nr:GNAT family N-acetyltransferase [Verrucomicrobiae bacterium]
MTQLEVSIRPGVPEDANGILECLVSTLAERQWFDRDEHEVGINSPDILKERIRGFKPGERAYLVAVLEGKIIGFILVVRGSLNSTRHAADFGMSILPGFRDRGLGTQLVEAAIDWAKLHRVEKLYCCTLCNNIRAIKLYEKLGFRQEGIRIKQFKIAGKYVDQILFGKLLNEG